ncbi:hypothetical protein A9267_11445 [Shewanella sp. UCD-FRSSP16_17]|uniref:DUF2971 domain-containing protein n=1 Tax=Shewanella sp. UCD-FRSSP16_17 TaxID=1853256 RepID=UPI0007EEF379|nr:DUF2971 domain-containing protein [Shewanella sp. UCD-FRSSP16_17]OBT08311.1 hypothetical protein A9267_11445 [Shewanella sp. UCD-FRSSP16_17]
MRSFYKYMPYSTLIKFLKDPCLRVTPSNCQNDPFEFGYSSSDLEILNSKSSSKELGFKLKEFAELHGIISLTTSYKNIMMWSHYAENHRGAVVELHIDEKKPESLFINSTGPNKPPFNFQDFIFNKVSYSKTRKFDLVEPERQLENVKHHYYFTKAIQWEGENEHRFITPMLWVNRIIFNQEGYEKAQRILGDYSSAICCNKNTGYTTYELEEAAIEVIALRNIELLAELWLESNINEIMFFTRLNTGTPGIGGGRVGRIFIGCEADHKDLISQLKSNNSDQLSIMDNYLNPINGDLVKVFKAEIHQDEYKLTFKPVNGNVHS